MWWADAMLNDPAVNVGTTELISFSETAWKLADSSFPQIIADANKLYDEFRTKWMQRFSTDEVMRLMPRARDCARCSVPTARSSRITWLSS